MAVGGVCPAGFSCAVGCEECVPIECRTVSYENKAKQSLAPIEKQLCLRGTLHDSDLDLISFHSSNHTGSNQSQFTNPENKFLYGTEPSIAFEKAAQPVSAFPPPMGSQRQNRECGS
jgi:hypothetical protein